MSSLPSPSTRVLRARRLLVDAATLVEDGGLVLRQGRVERIAHSAAALRRAEAAAGTRALDVDGGVVTAGLVDAHAHLELGPLEVGRPRSASDAAFLAWIGAVLAARRGSTAADHARAARDGARRLLETGTTTVGDLDTTGAASALAPHARPRLVSYREALDARDPARTPSALSALARAPRRAPRMVHAFAPHAPHTCSDELLRAIAARARRASAPVAVHWSETLAEVEWLANGSGPFARVLGGSPHASGLELLERAGITRRALSLVHGNHPTRGELVRVARAGATVVHCPGAHAWFGRAPFPWQRYRRAGVRLALGTDSLASNADLDMRREMALARAATPSLSPELVWSMATTGGARALGMEGLVGTLHRGAAADIVAHDVPAGSRRALLEALTTAHGTVERVWVAGEQVVRDGELEVGGGRRV